MTLHSGILFKGSALLGFCLAGMLNLSGDLILSLEEAIGKAPEKSETSGKTAPQVFYTLSDPEPDPEILELLQKQRMGFVLTAEEQLLVREQQMGVGVSGTNPLIRRIYPPVLTWMENSVKTPSGKRLPFIHCYPRAPGPFPVALVLDPEIGPQFEAGIEGFSRMIRDLPVEAELPYDEAYRGRYITNNPIGNQLISHAISVIIPIREALEDANSLPLTDWKVIMDYFLKKKILDPESLFLVASKEYAGLAIRLAGSYPFTGLVLEEPETGLFNTSLPGNVEDSMKMAALLSRYEAELEPLKCPVLLVRNKKNPVLRINDFILIDPLVSRSRPIYLGISDFPLRTLELIESSEDNTTGPTRFAYNFDSTEKFTNRMLYFIQQHGKAQLNLLPEESNEPRMRNRTGSALAELERIEGRLQGFIQDSQNFDLSGDQGFDGNVSGGGFDSSGENLDSP